MWNIIFDVSLIAIKLLNLNLSESILTLLLAFIYINHVEAFTLDRISILYFLIIQYFLKIDLSIILILFASIVNEKIVVLLGVLFFIRKKSKNYKSLFFSSFSQWFLLVISIFYFYSIILGHQGII